RWCPGRDGSFRSWFDSGHNRDGFLKEVRGMKSQIILSLFLLLFLGLQPLLHAQQPLQLSLKQAVDAALEPGGNVQVQLAREAVRQAEAHAEQVRADLLPDISASVGQQSQTVSLTAYGLQSANLADGIRLPEVVGPFNTFDARGKVTQKLFD